MFHSEIVPRLELMDAMKQDPPGTRCASQEHHQRFKIDRNTYLIQTSFTTITYSFRSLGQTSVAQTDKASAREADAYKNNL